MTDKAIKKTKEYRRDMICVKLATGHKIAIKRIAKEKKITLSILVRTIVADFLGAI
jgi:hypothetical protein